MPIKMALCRVLHCCVNCRPHRQRVRRGSVTNLCRHKLKADGGVKEQAPQAPLQQAHIPGHHTRSPQQARVHPGVRFGPVPLQQGQMMLQEGAERWEVAKASRMRVE